MPTPSPELREKLLQAISESDARTRAARLERVVWISDHDRLPGAIMGRAETLHMLGEARSVFINGHFAAALLLALAVIEHSLVRSPFPVEQIVEITGNAYGAQYLGQVNPKH